MAQQTDDLHWDDVFSSDWQKLEELSKEGKQGSRYTLSQAIFDKAIQSQNVPAVIKSLIVMVNSSYYIDDEALLSMIQAVESKKPTSSILQAILDSYTAEMYSLYFERHRYKISNRTDTSSISSDDLSLWSEANFIDKMKSLYMRSVQPQGLKTIESSKFQSVYPDDEALDYTWLPTLYDLLMDRNIQFLQNKRYSGIPSEISMGEDGKASYFSEDLQSVLESDNKYPSADIDLLQAYSDWEQFHLSRKDYKVYLEIVLQRAELVHGQFATNSDTPYVNLLDGLMTTYKEEPHILKAYYLKAILFQGKGDYITAKSIVDSGLSLFSNTALPSDVAALQQVLKSILAKELQIEMEYAYPKKLSVLFNINYRNIDDVNFQLFKLTPEEFVQYNYQRRNNENQIISDLKGKKVIWEKAVKLNNLGDYDSHSSEYILDKNLSYGQYGLYYYTESSGFRIAGCQLFQISNINVIDIQLEEKKEMHILDRTSGSAIKNAELALFESNYGDLGRPVPMMHSKVDGGRFIINDKGLGKSTYVKVVRKKDIYFSPRYYTGRRYPSENYEDTKTVMYTDRAIYQPGQKIFVKGLVVSSNRLTSDLLKNKAIDLYLRDANGQEVWKKSLTTDEWGSYTAIIPIPNQGLKGNWTLSSNLSGQKSILIEEYKRPNYEIHFNAEDIKMTPKSVNGFGYLKTYAGFPIQEGKVKIEVYLKQQQRWFYYPGNEKPILLFSTEVNSDDNGRFEFQFEPIIPLKNDGWSSYNYDFSISATALSGEIQETSVLTPVDENKKYLSIDVSDQVKLNSGGLIKLKAKDGLGNPTPWSGKIVVSSLRLPEKYMVPRLWANPDQPIVSLEKYDSHIMPVPQPSMETWELWEIETVVYQEGIDLDGSLDLMIDAMIKNPGYYKIEVVQDDGKSVDQKYLFGYDDEDFDLMHSPFVVDINKDQYQPGDEVELRFYTHKKLKQLLLVYVRPSGEEKIISLKGNQTYKIKLRASDLGGIPIKVIGQLYNRTKIESYFIDIPWREKSLKIIRNDGLDSLDVNKDYSLDFNIVDVYGQGLPSEVAIAIYDASLDAYKANEWTTENYFFRKFNSYIHANILSTNLAQVIGFENNYWDNPIDVPRIHKPQLPNIGLQYPVRGTMYMAKSMSRNDDGGLMEVASEAAATDMVASPPSPEVEGGEEGGKRSDFSENLLFVGKLHTAEDGSISIPFSTNDKIGRWKVLVLAHDTALATATYSFDLITKKDVYVESYLPEYMRQGDLVNVRYTIFNTTSKPINGVLELSQMGMWPDSSVHHKMDSQSYQIPANGSKSYSFAIEADAEAKDALRLVAKLMNTSGHQWDEVEHYIDILPSKENIISGDMVVLKPGETYRFNQLITTDSKIKQVKLRIIDNMYVELLKSLPYLDNPQPRTTDQMLRNYLYATLGQYIGQKIPGFEELYQSWKSLGQLKGRLGDESMAKYQPIIQTPWVKQNASMEEQMQMMALYFDDNHMRNIISQNFDKWMVAVNPDGGFPWISGWPSDPYITLRLLASLAKIESLNIDNNVEPRIIENAISYLDKVNFERWTTLTKADPERKDKIGISFLNYFEVRSQYMDEYEIQDIHQDFWDSIKKVIYAEWTSVDWMQQVQIGKSAHYLHDHEFSLKIAESFVDNAIQSKKLGTYWRYNFRGSQANYLYLHAGIMDLLNLNSISQLNEGAVHWIVVQKMTNDWHENPAVFDLMLAAMKATPQTLTMPGNVVLQSAHKTYSDSNRGGGSIFDVATRDLSTLHAVNLGGQPVWLGIQWIEEVQPEDVVIVEDSPLDIKKSVIIPSSRDTIVMGDKIMVQLLLETDRDLDYVYVSDPLVPGLDEGIAFSGFKTINGLSLYQTFDPDKAMFFIRHLPKGKHVLEYELGVVRSGQFVMPRSKIQSFYTPEISGHDQWRPRLEIK
ncbi:alpha-2-macroglobulin family protein [Membranihabitans marinus]